MADYVNIDYKIHLVKDNNYGKKFRNGTWNGMIGELVRGVGMHTSIMGISWDKSNSPIYITIANYVHSVHIIFLLTRKERNTLVRVNISVSVSGNA